jgi:glycosyltransferase involved in cell wall biosynthesis
MTIGIEAERANHPQKTGVEHYAKQLILNLAEIDKTNTYKLYLRSQPEAWFFKLPKNFSVKVMPFPIFWTQFRLSWEMLFNPVDALFIPASALPLIHPKKSFVTIHDIAWKFYPQAFTPFMRWFLDWSTAFACRHAYRIIAVSESTKKDLVKFYSIKPDKISVVHHGYGQRLKINDLRFKSQQSIPEKYILFLSTLQPRKNLEGLIEAFKLLKKEDPQLPHKLVVVGKPGWKFESILTKINENKDSVLYLNHVTDAEKWQILKGADALVVPSFYEGFGMQVLEAFEAVVPVAASRTSSLPEVAGDAAIYFDPKNLLEIKTALRTILSDRGLADNLRQKGTERLKNFSWQKCAFETLNLLQN